VTVLQVRAVTVVGADVGVAERLHQLAQLRHRHPVVAAHVDAAEQRDLPCHDARAW
jgi:hypothetical protein